MALGLHGLVRVKNKWAGSAAVEEVYVNNISKHELTCPLCMSPEESDASICSAYCLHPLRFAHREHTHTHEALSHFSYARIGVAPQSVPVLASMLTESLVCEFNKKLYAAAADALAHLPP